MKTLTLVILETDPDYGGRLAKYISSREDSPFLVRLFLTHPCPAGELLQADAVVSDAALWPQYQDLPRTCPVLVLTEDGADPDGADASAYKYSSASLLLDALQRCFLDHSGRALSPEILSSRSFRISALYTPACGPEASSAVLALIRESARSHSVLYLNMEQVPSRITIQEDSGEGLSALIYYLKQYRENLGARISMMVRREDFDFLLPAEYPGELLELSASDWRQLADALQRDTTYEQVFFDFGAALPCTDALPCCDEILVLHGGSQWDSDMADRFSLLLERAGGEDIRERIRVISRR